MVRSIVWVLLGILVVLILLLRALVAPIYLILTILLSYGATLGIVRLVFTDLLGGAGVTWWVPIFMFVMLVALGMDYNIFLMGRVKEEVGRLPNREGTARAVSRTGGIITSAGIIMAGTFAAMMASSILGLVQIGFAVAVGVLLDTFVVRTAMVPALVTLLGRWSWWPRRQPGPIQTTLPEAARREAAEPGGSDHVR
jgi:RND superfamily putative drug exporter